jgi:hypothetical protein
MIEKLAQADEGWGVHAHPLSLYLPSRTKLWCTLQLKGQIHPPISTIPQYVLCGMTACEVTTSANLSLQYYQRKDNLSHVN